MLAPEDYQRADLWFQQGNDAYQTRQWEQALACYQRACEYRPDSGLLWQNIAACYEALGQSNNCIQALETALDRNPKLHSVRYHLAQSYLNTYQLPKAQALFFALLPLPEYQADAHFGLGVILMRQNKWYAAQVELQAVLEIKPDFMEALINLATCYMKQQLTHEAIPLLKRVLTFSPSHSIAQYRLAALTGEQQPPRAPMEYVEALFDHYADYFDQALMGQLKYRVPERMKQLWQQAQTPAIIPLAYDLGCGTGLVGKLFSPLCKQLIGIDLSSRMIALAHESGHYQALYIGDILTELPKHPPGDLLLAGDLLCYFGDLAPVFSVLAQNLAPGGWLLCTTERGHHNATYHLQTNCRYQHHTDYVRLCATQAGLTCIQLESDILRQELGQAVIGDYGLWQLT